MANPLCHFEFVVPDPAKTRAFYERVFRWTYREDPLRSYTVIHTGEEPNGGIVRAPAGSAAQAALHAFVLVDDVAETLAKVEAAGGRVVHPETVIPAIGTFALFADPDGIVLGIFASDADEAA